MVEWSESVEVSGFMFVLNEEGETKVENSGMFASGKPRAREGTSKAFREPAKSLPSLNRIRLPLKVVQRHLRLIRAIVQSLNTYPDRIISL